MSGRAFRFLLVALLSVLMVDCGEPTKSGKPAKPGLPGIPDRTVVLTLDDTVANHLTFVVPLLERLGFGATFFHTARFPRDRRQYLKFAEVAEIHRRGFEVGDHTVTHSGFHRVHMAKQLVMESEDMERVFGVHGIPKPVSFAWPGGAFGPESLAVLRGRGYRFGRRGLAPEFPPLSLEVGSVYDPARNDPLLIPTTGTAQQSWTVPFFRRVISHARDGKAVVLQFHGVPDPGNPVVSVTPQFFESLMLILAKGDYNVIAMRDLAKYVDPKPIPSDPVTKMRRPDQK